MNITSTLRSLPSRVVIYGSDKIGKSTWASQAPSPVFIPTEDGQSAIDAQAFPLCRRWEDILDAISSLYNEEHEYKTVVLDSADWAEPMCFDFTCRTVEKDKGGFVKSIEGYGYGKGYGIAADIFRSQLLEGLDALRTHRGMGVILIAHSEIKRYDDPLADSYDRHQIKLQKQIGALVREWADAFCFAQERVLTKGEDVGYNKVVRKAIDTGRRILCTVGSAAYDAGNRYGLPAELDLNYAAFGAALTAASAAKAK